jgi:hypothetical protein
MMLIRVHVALAPRNRKLPWDSPFGEECSGAGLLRSGKILYE